MLHHHLPFLLSRAALYGRHAIDLCNGAVKLVEIGLCRLGAPALSLGRGSKASRAGRHGAKPLSVRLRQRSPLLIHYHILKNAGSSFEWALEQALGNAYRSFDSPSAAGFVSARDLVEFSFRHAEVKAISSHQAAPPPPRIFGREIFTSILIRDPIARIRSIYAFERAQEKSSPGAIKAKELTFRQYVEWRLNTSPATLCNFQVYFCSRTSAGTAQISGEERLERAIRNLDGISLVGTVARFDEWLALVQKVLSSSFPNLALASVRQNASLGIEPSEGEILGQLISELGDTTAQYLLDNNELDMCLHQVADALLTRRLAEHGVGLRLLKAYTNTPGARPSSHWLSKIG